jgi:hypothetical protein
MLVGVPAAPQLPTALLDAQAVEWTPQRDSNDDIIPSMTVIYAAAFLE